MAVGKGSMARASKAVEKPGEAKNVESEVKATVEVKEDVKAEIKPEVKTEVKTEAKAAPTKKKAVKKASPVKEKAVISATSKQVMDKIVYQSCSQILERDAEPNENFYVGDDMPIYFY